MATALSRALRTTKAIAGATTAAAFTVKHMASATPVAPLAVPPPGACRPIVLCGPSGAGKSTLITMLQKDYPEDFGFSVSHTTRGPRAGEEDGVHYHFVSKEEMEAGIAAGKFLEHACVHGNFYGTSFAAVDNVSAAHKVCILDIDVQGVKSCKAAGFNAEKYVFIAPPDLGTLEARLRGRGTETEDRIQKRLANAVGEMAESKVMVWDAYIVNDDVHKAYEHLREVTASGRASCASARASARASEASPTTATATDSKA